MYEFLKTVFWSMYSFPTYLLLYILGLLIWAVIYQPSIWLFVLVECLIFPPFLIWRSYYLRISKKNDDAAWKVIHRIEAELQQRFLSYPEDLRNDLLQSGLIPEDWDKAKE